MTSVRRMNQSTFTYLLPPCSPSPCHLKTTHHRQRHPFNSTQRLRTKAPSFPSKHHYPDTTQQIRSELIILRLQHRYNHNDVISNSVRFIHCRVRSPPVEPWDRCVVSDSNILVRRTNAFFYHPKWCTNRDEEGQG
jgi:hypothetical protein